VTAVRLRERWAAVEAGFAAHYNILDLGGRFDGNPVGYRKFLVLLTDLGILAGEPAYAPESAAAGMPAVPVASDEPPPGWWREVLPVPTPKIGRTVSLDQFTAGLA